MSESEDESSKTEEPTQKKLDEARKKGQTFSSRELNHFFMMLALAAFIMVMAPNIAKQFYILLAPFITMPDSINLQEVHFNDIIKHVVFSALAIIALPLLATWAAAIAPSVIQNKWVFSTESIKPKFSKLSPMSGLGRLFGVKALVEFGKNMLKVAVVAIIVYVVLKPYANYLYGVPTLSKAQMLDFAQKMAGKMMVAVCIMLFLLSIFDYFWQRFSFMKSMRMSKQELKEEYKQQEGDPHIKGKLKAIRREKARQRMMANVPKADVIITNPTHYAVALQYDPQTMPAPKLIAKGTDDVAGRIREMAQGYKIPIVRNPPLARILYDTTDLDEDIPVEHYAAVAKVIGYVYKLKGKAPPQRSAPKGGKPGGMTLNMPGKKKK